MLLAPDAMRLRPEERDDELGPPSDSEDDEDEEPPSDGVAHSDER